MTSRAASKLLETMRLTKSDWGQKDFHRLLQGYGFINKGGKKHNKYYHPEHLNLWISIPRHNILKEWVAVESVKLIDELITKEKKRNETKKS